jgi:hypothetical protein
MNIITSHVLEESGIIKTYPTLAILAIRHLAIEIKQMCDKILFDKVLYIKSEPKRSYQTILYKVRGATKINIM